MKISAARMDVYQDSTYLPGYISFFHLAVISSDSQCNPDGKTELLVGAQGYTEYQERRKRCITTQVQQSGRKNWLMIECGKKFKTMEGLEREASSTSNKGPSIFLGGIRWFPGEGSGNLPVYRTPPLWLLGI